MKAISKQWWKLWLTGRRFDDCGAHVLGIAMRKEKKLRQLFYVTGNVNTGHISKNKQLIFFSAAGNKVVVNALKK